MADKKPVPKRSAKASGPQGSAAPARRRPAAARQASEGEATGRRPRSRAATSPAAEESPAAGPPPNPAPAPPAPVGSGRPTLPPALLALRQRQSFAGVGRNDLCPCGSGKRYKNCHGH